MGLVVEAQKLLSPLCASRYSTADFGAAQTACEADMVRERGPFRKYLERCYSQVHLPTTLRTNLMDPSDAQEPNCKNPECRGINTNGIVKCGTCGVPFDGTSAGHSFLSSGK